MGNTINKLEGTWTLYVILKKDETVTYQLHADFAADGTVTATGMLGSGTSFSGTWTQDGDAVKFNLTPAGGGTNRHFSGFLVGYAMGGAMNNAIGLPIVGTWSGCGTPDNISSEDLVWE